MSFNSHRHPILNSLLDRGVIYVDGSEYVGITPEPEDVNLGTIGLEEALEAYLKDYPDPSNW